MLPVPVIGLNPSSQVRTQHRFGSTHPSRQIFRRNPVRAQSLDRSTLRRVSGCNPAIRRRHAAPDPTFNESIRRHSGWRTDHREGLRSTGTTQIQLFATTVKHQGHPQAIVVMNRRQRPFQPRVRGRPAARQHRSKFRPCMCDVRSIDHKMPSARHPKALDPLQCGANPDWKEEERIPPHSPC